MKKKALGIPLSSLFFRKKKNEWKKERKKETQAFTSQLSSLRCSWIAWSLALARCLFYRAEGERESGGSGIVCITPPLNYKIQKHKYDEDQTGRNINNKKTFFCYEWFMCGFGNQLVLALLGKSVWDSVVILQWPWILLVYVTLFSQTHPF